MVSILRVEPDLGRTCVIGREAQACDTHNRSRKASRSRLMSSVLHWVWLCRVVRGEESESCELIAVSEGGKGKSRVIALSWPPGDRRESPGRIELFVCDCCEGWQRPVCRCWWVCFRRWLEHLDLASGYDYP